MPLKNKGHKYSPIAQSVERMTVNHDVVGSSPTGGVIWPLGQVVKTPPFHGDNMGSNPVGVIKNPYTNVCGFFTYYIFTFHYSLKILSVRIF